MAAVRLWVDTDVGTNPDDSVALLCALADPDVELVGVSTVGADAEWRAGVALTLLPESVPVVAGASAAVEAIPGAGPDLVLGIGPLTNLAALAVTGWRPPRTVVMGGVLTPIRYRGEVRRVESNFAADPSAAAVVLGGPEVTVVPLDATMATKLTPGMLHLLVGFAPGIIPTVERWFASLPRAQENAIDRAVHLHDPAALLVAVGEPVARLEPKRLVVEADGALREHPDGECHQVVVDLDGPAVVKRVLALLRPQ
jgi:inosine-uridine nucleoside N-ribohydrolase